MSYFLTILLVFLLAVNSLTAQIYFDSRGNEVVLPAESASFADEIAEFNNGTPYSEKEHAVPTYAIGEPDFEKWFKPGSLSLGCYGSVTIKFTDNALVNVPGPDLYIFETGNAVEPIRVEISRFGYHFIDIGIIDGSFSATDIEDVVLHDKEYFHYVRITDMGSMCGNPPVRGADIDAVAAIGSVDRQLVDLTSFRERDLILIDKNIEVKNQKLEISLWDNAKADGDVVSLFLNGERKCLISNHKVDSYKKSIDVTLPEEVNLLILYAENEGSIPPNTAAIRIKDGYSVQNIVLSADRGMSEAIRIKQK